MTNLHEKVYILIGEASLCWSESPQGIFDATKALEIGDKFILELSKLEKVAEAAREYFSKDREVRQISLKDGLQAASNAWQDREDLLQKYHEVTNGKG